MAVRITKTSQQQLRRTFIKQWRIYRGLSMDKVLARMEELVNGFSKASLSRIENGKQAYTQDILEALAEVYLCEPQDLLMRDPTRADAPWSLKDTLPPMTPPAQREAVERIVEGIRELIKKPTGTDD